MNIINGITDQPTQVLSFTLADGSQVTLTLYFRPQQNGWFFDVNWPGSSTIITPFKAQNLRLVAAANLLRQYQELIPFGLACFSVDNSDPATQECLVDGSVQLVLLNQAEVVSVDAQVYAAP